MTREYYLVTRILHLKKGITMHHSILHFWKHYADQASIRWSGGTILLGIFSSVTTNQVTLFFTVAVGMTAIILNIVKTQNEVRKAKREKLLWEEKHEVPGGKEEEADD